MKTGMFLVAVLLVVPGMALAAIPAQYTNDNLFTSEHDKPVSLHLDGVGGFYGYTEHGFRFTQKPVANDFGIRLHKFTIGEAYFYMSDRGMIRAEGDLAAVSIYFSRA